MFFFASFFKFHTTNIRLINSEKEATFQLLWLDVHVLTTKCYSMVCDINRFQCSKYSWRISGKFILGSSGKFWLLVLIELVTWSDCRSAEDGSWQSLFMLSPWTSWAPRDGAIQFDFHQHVDSNYTTCGEATIKQGSWKRRHPVKWWRGYVRARTCCGVKPDLD